MVATMAEHARQLSLETGLAEAMLEQDEEPSLAQSKLAFEKFGKHWKGRLAAPPPPRLSGHWQKAESAAYAEPQPTMGSAGRIDAKSDDPPLTESANANDGEQCNQAGSSSPRYGSSGRSSGPASR